MASYTKLSQVVIKALLVVGGGALVVMMAIVAGNSLGRALFRTPIFGAIEIAGLAGAVVVAVAVGFTERERRNIVVDVVTSRFTPHTRALVETFTLFLSLGAVAFLAWAIFTDAVNSVTIGETTLTTGVRTAPFKFTWAIGVILLCLFLVQHMIETIRGRGKR
jgi:TRAP-type C4-dicarboxylate transport system permease small subunit